MAAAPEARDDSAPRRTGVAAILASKRLSRALLDALANVGSGGWRPEVEKPVRWIAAGAGVAVAAVVAALWIAGGETGTPVANAETFVVERGEVALVATAVGTVNPSRHVEVGAQVSGQLQKLHVEVGDLVAQGDLLAEIDATVQVGRVEAGRATLESARASLRGVEDDLKLAESLEAKWERLRDGGAVSELDYEKAVNDLINARSALVSLRAAIERDRAKLASDEALLGFSRIHAPVAGTVVAIEAREGQTLNAAHVVPPILTIADLADMEVRAEVSEADIGKVRPDTPAWFTTFGGGERRWQAQVRLVLPTPEVENRVVSYPVVLAVDNADGSLLPGMTAQVFFATASAQDVLVAPTAALARDADGGATAQVLGRNGRVEARAVRTGLANRTLTEIVSGLEEGERILAEAR